MPTGFWIFEAAFRSVLMAAAVWAGIRLLRVKALRAQRLAWAMVLLAAAAMPLAMHSPLFANGLLGLNPVKIPLRPAAPVAPVQSLQPAIQRSASSPQSLIQTRRQKPSAAHRLEASDSAQSAASALPPIVAETDAPAPAQLADPTPKLSQAVKTHEPKQPGPFWNWSRIRSIGLALYGAVAIALLLRLILGLAIAFRIWRRAIPATHLNSMTDLRISRDLAAPVTIGSTVILPSTYRDWDSAKLRIMLAHEQSHMRQRDFYLQALAAFHAAAFWFSPLGWWLQRKLSELGEALSDRAGLAASPTPAAYAQILLQFAAQPRPSAFSSLFTGPLTGVPMARSSNLSSRIERVLSSGRFQLAAITNRRHAFLAAAIVPIALVGVVACIRIVPTVEAAQQTQNPGPAPSPAPAPTPATGQPVSGQISPSAPDQVTGTDTMQAPSPAAVEEPATPILAPKSPAPAPVAPMPPPPAAEKLVTPNNSSSEIAVPAIPAIPAMPAMAPMPPIPSRGFNYAYSTGRDSNGSFAIVGADGKNNVFINGSEGNGLEEAKQKYHNNFIWFRRDGKSYVITDPAFVAQCQSLFTGDKSLELKQADLERMQAKLNAEMANLKPEIDGVKLAQPEIDRQMAKVQQELSNMHLDKFSADLAQQFSPDKQAEFNRKIADLAAEAARARLAGPDLQTQISKMEQQLANLQSEAARQLSEKIARQLRDDRQLTDESTRRLTKQLTESETQAQIRNAEKLQEQAEKRLEELQDRMGDLQGHFGDIQGQLGDIQGVIGERMGEIGEKQGTIGERMGKIGEEMGKIGEEQGKRAEEAARKVQSLIDQAVKDGKAKQVQ